MIYCWVIWCTGSALNSSHAKWSKSIMLSGAHLTILLQLLSLGPHHTSSPLVRQQVCCTLKFPKFFHASVSEFQNLTCRSFLWPCQCAFLVILIGMKCPPVGDGASIWSHTCLDHGEIHCFSQDGIARNVYRTLSHWPLSATRCSFATSFLLLEPCTLRAEQLQGCKLPSAPFQVLYVLEYLKFANAICSIQLAPIYTYDGSRISVLHLWPWLPWGTVVPSL